jgi:hypothetical protein
VWCEHHRAYTRAHASSARAGSEERRGKPVRAAIEPLALASYAAPRSWLGRGHPSLHPHGTLRAGQRCHPQPAAIPRPAEPSPPLRQRARAAATRRPEPRGQQGFWTRLQKGDVDAWLRADAAIIVGESPGRSSVLSYLPVRRPLLTPTTAPPGRLLSLPSRWTNHCYTPPTTHRTAAPPGAPTTAIHHQPPTGRQRTPAPTDAGHTAGCIIANADLTVAGRSLSPRGASSGSDAPVCDCLAADARRSATAASPSTGRAAHLSDATQVQCTRRSTAKPVAGRNAQRTGAVLLGGGVPTPPRWFSYFKNEKTGR